MARPDVGPIDPSDPQRERSGSKRKWGGPNPKHRAVSARLDRSDLSDDHKVAWFTAITNGIRRLSRLVVDRGDALAILSI